jgi:hypothetical protein
MMESFPPLAGFAGDEPPMTDYLFSQCLCDRVDAIKKAVGSGCPRPLINYWQRPSIHEQTPPLGIIIVIIEVRPGLIRCHFIPLLPLLPYKGFL